MCSTRTPNSAFVLRFETCVLTHLFSRVFATTRFATVVISHAYVKDNQISKALSVCFSVCSHHCMYYCNIYISRSTYTVYTYLFIKYLLLKFILNDLIDFNLSLVV
jgi:hypothetical protein